MRFGAGRPRIDSGVGGPSLRGPLDRARIFDPWDPSHCIRNDFLSNFPLKMLKTVEYEPKNSPDCFGTDFSPFIVRPHH